MQETLSIRFLYHTACGRAILKLLVHPWISKRVGHFLSSPCSRCLIPSFRRKNGLSMDGITVPPKGFSSFNAFFTRCRESVTFDPDPGTLCSPCDAALSCYTIGVDSCFEIKHSLYSLSELMADDPLADSFQGGTALIFRLTPSHYHRYHYIDDGIQETEKRIPGILHCVRPIALARHQVYIQNSREYAVLDTVHFGQIVQMEIGALLVGKIKNHCISGPVQRGEEKGFFEFGGSTIVLLIKKDQIDLQPLLPCLDNMKEIPVKLGCPIAHAKL